MKLRTAMLLVGLPLGLVALGFTIPNANAQTVTILYSFGNYPTDGTHPHARLVQGSDGNFYGTTYNGGTSTNCYSGCGTVFRISPNGSYTNLYSFVGPPNDGGNPFGSLIQGSDGNFYGTTSNANGTVFRISPGGNYTNLHFFVGPPNDGRSPKAGLVQGDDGNFYGTAGGGGANNVGTVFRISPGGSLTNLYSFGSYGNDGKNPQAWLIQGSDGNFYGTCGGGGTAGGDYGTVFRISPNGIETNLHSFGSGNDGTYPIAGLVQDSDSNFYGTTLAGGPNHVGIVFRISPGGNYTNLHTFVGPPNDGGRLIAGLVQGSDGNFYGTTFAGGTSDDGTVFRISPGGSETVLYSFVGSPNDGGAPFGSLVQGSDGSFYGTTFYGGTSTNCDLGCGTVFKLTVPLNPPANQISEVQIAGNDIVINIPSVAYETYQLQFSSSMNPTNWVNVPGVSVTNSIGALLTLTNFGGAVGPQGFYRFAITP